MISFLASFQGVMSKACSWNTLEQQLSNEDYRNNLMDYIPISGATFNKFNDDSLGGNFMRDYSDLDSLSQPFLEKEKTNLDKSGFQTLYLQHEDIYNGLKYSFIENLPSVLKKIKTRKDFSTKPETVDFMNFVMDEATHLQNFPPPVDPSLARFVVAKHDAYVPRDNVMSPCGIWPGCTVEYINSGHVAASLNHQDVFRRVINDTLGQLS